MSQMELAALKAQHKKFLQSMFDEEVLDSQFAQVQALQDASNPNFVNELITLFCSEAERIIIELNKHLITKKFDFTKFDGYLHQLKGSSSSIGAHRLTLACVYVRQASDVRNKEGCLQGLNNITQEYFFLRCRFRTLVQLQKSISDIETYLR